MRSSAWATFVPNMCAVLMSPGAYESIPVALGGGRRTDTARAQACGLACGKPSLSAAARHPVSPYQGSRANRSTRKSRKARTTGDRCLREG